jgi:DNA-binding MarR family transcriptional regulator
MDLDIFPHGTRPSLSVLALASAARPGGARPRDLLEITSLSSGGVTLLLDRLEEQGLITRTSGRPPDRRAVVVGLTAAGAAALEQCMEQFERFSDQLAQSLV